MTFKNINETDYFVKVFSISLKKKIDKYIEDNIEFVFENAVQIS